MFDTIQNDALANVTGGCCFPCCPPQFRGCPCCPGSGQSGAAASASTGGAAASATAQPAQPAQEQAAQPAQDVAAPGVGAAAQATPKCPCCGK